MTEPIPFRAEGAPDDEGSDLGNEVHEVIRDTVDLFWRYIKSAEKALGGVAKSDRDFGTRAMQLNLAASKIRGALLIFDELKDRHAKAADLSEGLEALFWQSHKLAHGASYPDKNEELDIAARRRELEMLETLTDVVISLFAAVRPRTKGLAQLGDAMVNLWRNVNAVAADPLSPDITGSIVRIEYAEEAAISEKAVKIAMRMFRTMSGLEWGGCVAEPAA